VSVKQLVIVSGKGGTGKTSLAACFAALGSNMVIADCDVDAANLHILLSPDILQRQDFYGGVKAEIDPELCQRLGICREVCRFDAVSFEASAQPVRYRIDPIACDGCGSCVEFCVSHAIKMIQPKAGEWYLAETRFGPMVYARLGIGEENSGKLVSVVRKTSLELAEEKGAKMVLIDGPPGIGCPVIASITGTDYALAVTEPTMSGIHDLKRISELCRHFSIPLGVIINKFDLNPLITDEIKKFAQANNYDFVGQIPYTPDFTRAMVQRKSLIEFNSSPNAKTIKEIWGCIKNLIKQY